MSRINFLISLLTGQYVNIELIKRRLEQISRAGADGLTLSADCDIHTLGEAILHAKQLGLEVWLETDDTPRAAHGIAPLRLEYTGSEVRVLSDFSGTDPFHEMSAYTLLSENYERLKDGLPKEAFSYITGFAGRIDRLISSGGSHSAPWYDGFEADYLERYNVDPTPFLDEIFKDNAAPSRFRARYRQMIINRIKESYIRPITERLEQDGKRYIPIFDCGKTLPEQINACGSWLQLCSAYGAGSVSVPSPEALCGFCTAAAASAAHQSGTAAAASVFGGTAPGLTPGEFETVLSRLIKNGISTFILNSCFLTRDAESQRSGRLSFIGLPWEAAFTDILSKLRKQSRKPPKILVVCPSRGMFEQYIPGTRKPEADALDKSVSEICGRLEEMHKAFDITDEVLFEENSVFENNSMRLGEAEYTMLLTIPGCSFSKKGMLSLEKAKANGVRLLSDIPKSDTEIIPLDQIRETLVVPATVHQDSWTLTLPDENRMPLRFNAQNGSARFKIEKVPPTGLTLLLSDPCGEVSVNNILLSCARSDEHGFYYNITDTTIPGVNTVSVQGCSDIKAYITGDFKVNADCGYIELGRSCLQTRNTFTIKEAGSESSIKLTAMGYPFCSKPVLAKKIIYLDETILNPILRLDCSHSSMTEVYFDNEYAGILYAGRETLSLPPMNAGEQHVLQIRCCPHASNIFGGTDPGGSGNIKLLSWELPHEAEIIQQF